MRLTCVVTSALLVSALTLQAFGANQVVGDRVAIEGLIAARQAAWNAGDTGNADADA